MANGWMGCPVEGCEYSGGIASVAGHVSGKKDARHDWQRLGYDGANHFKQVQYQGESSSKATQVLHIADTHIGKKEGGYGSKSWPVDCAEGFSRAIDAVFHTGDLFHNDRHGITQDQIIHCEVDLAQLNNAGIPFYYILGDHERKEGARAFERFEDSGLAIHLTDSPALVGDSIALYGADYKDSEWWERARWSPDPSPTNRQSILALHQSLTPLTNSDRPECDAEDILRRTRANSGFQFDAIALGQLHRKIDRRIGGCQIVCGGATERLGRTRDAFTPFVGSFSSSNRSGVSYQCHPLV
jgi:exonuclease SbcD